MKIKRFIAGFITVMILLSICTGSLSALDAGMASDMAVAMNPVQMSLFKRALFQKGLDEFETARAILRQVGYPENIIQALPEDKLLQVADSRRIEIKEEYVCIQPNGEVIVSTKQQYEAEQAAASDTSVLSSGTSTPTTNSWAELTTYVLQSNSKRTEYTYSCACVWLKNPFMRKTDHIAIGVTRGSVNPDTTLAIFAYTVINYDTKTTTDTFLTKSGQNQITIDGTTANCYFPLPVTSAYSESYGTMTGVDYKDVSMALWLDGTQTDSPYSDPMNITSAYFHQVAIAKANASISVSYAGIGISFSIFPSTSFSKIMNSLEWIHKI